MNDPETRVITRERASHRLDPLGEVPFAILEDPEITHSREDEMDSLLLRYSQEHLSENMKFMRVSLIGEENTGKSALLNALVESHVALVASKSGSTQ